MPFYRMLLPDGSVHAEAEHDDAAAASAWARTERGHKSGMLGYKIQEWSGTVWMDKESSEIHVGTSPTYTFGPGPSDPPANWSDEV